MINDIWINLPSTDLSKTRTFFEAIGFTYNEKYSHDRMASFIAPGKVNLVICFFPPDHLKKFMGNIVADSHQSNEVLISVGANSKEEVDALAKTVTENGGTVFSDPSEIDGWMYNCAFMDPDGNRWNSLYMDMSKIPK